VSVTLASETPLAVVVFVTPLLIAVVGWLVGRLINRAVGKLDEIDDALEEVRVDVRELSVVQRFTASEFDAVKESIKDHEARIRKLEQGGGP
jgi:hypothetical protein